MSTTDTTEGVRLLTIQEVADRLGISERSVRRNAARTRAGRMKFPLPIRIGGAVRWRQQDLTEYIEALPQE